MLGLCYLHRRVDHSSSSSARLASVFKPLELVSRVPLYRYLYKMISNCTWQFVPVSISLSFSSVLSWDPPPPPLASPPLAVPGSPPVESAATSEPGMGNSSSSTPIHYPSSSERNGV